MSLVVNCVSCGRPVHTASLVGLVHTETGQTKCMQSEGTMTHLPLTPTVRSILGRPCFQCINTAQLLRIAGHEIAKKAEDEQAVTIWWLLNQYLKHGEGKWMGEANSALKEMHKQYIASLPKEEDNA